MSRLFLTFFGDSAHWENIQKIPAYPSGMSYFRPFRYRDERIQPEVLKIIEDTNRRESLSGRECLICMRFEDEKFKWNILPIRKGKVVKVDYSPGEHSVYFTLSEFFDYSLIDNLEKSCLVLPEYEQPKIKNCILFESELNCPDSLFVGKSNETKAWVDYLDKITRDKSLPIKDEARNSLFFRIDLPERSEKSPKFQFPDITPDEHYCGLVLTEGKPYKLHISHRIPMLISTRTSIQPIMIDITNPSHNIDISPSNEDVSGNYQNHIITLIPKKPSTVWEQIIITPPKDAKSQDGNIINTFSLNLSFKFVPSFNYKFLTQYCWIILFWVSLMASLFIDRLLAIKENETNIWLILSLVVSTFFTSFGVFKLNQKGISIR